MPMAGVPYISWSDRHRSSPKQVPTPLLGSTSSVAIGLVTRVVWGEIEPFGGNTNEAGSREGDGVYEKTLRQGQPVTQRRSP